MAQCPRLPTQVWLPPPSSMPDCPTLQLQIPDGPRPPAFLPSGVASCLAS